MQPHYNVLTRFPLDIKTPKKNILDALVIENISLSPHDGHVKIHGLNIALGRKNFEKWLDEYGNNYEFRELCSGYLDDYYLAVSERWPELDEIVKMVPKWAGICYYDASESKRDIELAWFRDSEPFKPSGRMHTLERALLRFTTAMRM